MLNYITDEEKFVEDILNNQNKNTINIANASTTICIKLIVKYYYIKGIKDKYALINEVSRVMEQKYFGYKRNTWIKKIEEAVDGVIAQEKKGYEVVLNKTMPVEITKAELDKIRELNNIKLERMAFVMLVYHKMVTQKTNKNYFQADERKLARESKTDIKNNNAGLMIGDLIEKGYIKNTIDGQKNKFELLYINVDSPTVITVDDFNGVVYSYLLYIGEKWKKCEECGQKWFQIKGAKDNSKKYCAICAKVQKIAKTVQKRKTL